MLKFKITVASVIKRKKPWSQLRWIGSKKESICLLDKNRASILYLPSGRTKRNISALQPYMKEVVLNNTSSDGIFVVLLLTSGRVIKWNKDNNSLTIIEACPDFNLISGSGYGSCNLFISNDGHHIFLMVNYHTAWICELNADLVETNNMVEGKWSSISLGLSSMESLSFKETAIDCMFFQNEEQGKCCLCCLVCNFGDRILVYSLLIQWHQPCFSLYTNLTFSSNIQRSFVPLNDFTSGCKPIRHSGAYLTRLSHDGSILAIFINQRQPKNSLLIFVHPYTSTCIKSDLKAVGSTSPNILSKYCKSYWIADAAWTSDDLFLSCITKRGSVLMFARLGEAVMLITRGLGMEFGPTLFLPLLPSIENYDKSVVRVDPFSAGTSPPSIASTTASEKTWKQRYSITTHPRLPILLCSDGFNVIALQMNEFAQIPDLASNALISANKLLRKMVRTFKFELKAGSAPKLELRNALVESAQFKEHYLLVFVANLKKKFKKKKKRAGDSSIFDTSGQVDAVGDENLKLLAYKFEELEENESKFLDDEDETSVFGAPGGGIIRNADRGRVRFGDFEEEELQNTDDSCIILDEDQVVVDSETLMSKLDEVITYLRLAWSLMMSEENKLTSHHLLAPTDHLQDFFLQTLNVICCVILEAQDICLCLPWDATSDGDEIETRRLLTDVIIDVMLQLSLISGWGGNILRASLIRKSLRICLSTLLQSRRYSPEGCIGIKDLSDNIAFALTTLHRVELYIKTAYSFQPSHIEVIDGHKLDIGRFQCWNVVSSTQQEDVSILPQLWCDLNQLIVKLQTSGNYKQISSGLLLTHAYVQSRMHKQVISLPDDGGDGNKKTLAEVHFSQIDILLCDYRLRKALDLGDNLSKFLTKATSVDEKIQWGDAYAVELLASVMSSYFANEQISFSTRSPFLQREITLDRSRIVKVIKEKKLSQRWSADSAILYLLKCGQLLHAAALTQKLQDWRTSLTLASMAYQVRPQLRHQSVTSAAASECRDRILREEFRRKVSFLLAEDEDGETMFDGGLKLDQLYPTLHDMYVVAIMVGSDLVSWSVCLLLDHLKELCRDISMLVDEDVYLPAPPLYLPQPTIDYNKPGLKAHLKRAHVSMLVRTLLIVFHSIGATSHAVTWYLRRLQRRTDQLNTSLQQTLSQHTTDSSTNLSSTEALVLLDAFRDFCFILWMLETRDNLSVGLRRYQTNKCLDSDDFVDAATDALKLAQMFRPFAAFKQCQIELHDLVFCLAADLPVRAELVRCVASFMPGVEGDVPPKMQDRFRVYEQRLRQVQYHTAVDEECDDDTSSPMSVYFHEQRVEFDKLPFEHVFMLKSRLLARSGAEAMDKCDRDDESDTSQQILVRSGHFSSSLRHEYAFEASQEYHAFMAQLCEVITDRFQVLIDSSASRKRKKDMAPNMLLIMSNRRMVAIDQLQRVETKKKLQRQLEFDEDTLSFAVCPPALRKRLVKLKPFASWLTMWSNKAPSSVEKSMAAIRVNVGSEDLVWAVGAAEMRFNRTTTTISRDDDDDESQSSQTSTKHDGLLKVEASDEEITLVSSMEHASGSKSTGWTPQQQSTTAWTSTPQQPPSSTAIPSSEVSPITETKSTTSGSISTSAFQGATTTDNNAKTSLAASSKHDQDSKLLATLPENGTLPSLKADDDSFDRTAASSVGNETTTMTTKQRTEKKKQQRQREEKEKSPSSVVVVAASNQQEQISQTVRSEIHNVLLAQQVSLLSQLLLGQTLTDATNKPAAGLMNNNPIVNTLLQNIQGFGGDIQPTRANMENRQPPQQQPIPRQPHKKQQNNNGMPLLKIDKDLKTPLNYFHGMPLIQLPKDNKTSKGTALELISTPQTGSCWGKEDAPGKKSVSKVLLRGTKPLKISVSDGAIPHQLIHGYKGEIQAPSQLPVKLGHNMAQYEDQEGVSNQVLANERAQYSTQFPIIIEQAGRSEISRPQFQPSPKRPQPHRQLFVPLLQAPTYNNPQSYQQYHQQQQQAHRVVPRLIDPREVLGYHHRKYGGFTNTQGRPASSFRNILPQRTAAEIPVTKSSVPIKLLGLPKDEPTSRMVENKISPQTQTSSAYSPPVKLLKAARHCQVEVEKEDQITQTVPVKAVKLAEDEPLFDGYYDAEVIRRQVEKAIISGKIRKHEGDFLSSGQAHCMACFGKHQTTQKCRVKNAKHQTGNDKENEEPMEGVEEEDYKNKLETKPLQPPPDIFMKMRFDYDRLLEDDCVGENEFIHVSNVDPDQVKRGLNRKPPQQSSTTAEEHYSAVKQLRPDSTPQAFVYDPGFAGVEKGENLLTEHVKFATKVLEVREETRNAWSNSMKQMSLQLSAMEEAARKIHTEFKSSTSLAQTVENISKIEEARRKSGMTQTIDKETTERALSPIKELASSSSERRLDDDDECHPNVELFKPKYPPPRRWAFPHYAPELTPTDMRNVLKFGEVATDEYGRNLNEAYKLLHPPQFVTPTDEAAEEVNVEKSLTFEGEGECTEDEKEVSFYDEIQVDDELLTDNEYQNWKMNLLSQVDSSLVFSDFDDEVHRSLDMKQQGNIPFKEDPDVKKEKIRRWMKQKQRERNHEYLGNLKKLREKEHKPFNNGRTYTTRQLEELNKDRMDRKKDMSERHLMTTIEDGLKLVDEMKEARSKCNGRAWDSSTKRPKMKKGGSIMTKPHRVQPYKKPRLRPSQRNEDDDDYEEEDLRSIISDWKLDTRVEEILYGGSKKKKKSPPKYTTRKNDYVTPAPLSPEYDDTHQQLQQMGVTSQTMESSVSSHDTMSLLNGVEL